MINRELKIHIVISSTLTVILSAVCLLFSKICAAICFLLGIVLTVVFCVYTANRYRKLNILNDYLSQICSGNYDLDISDNTEGELSILKNNLYKVITILKTQNEKLASDKIYLADSLADISHQLKTPLTSMMVISDLLRDEKSVDKRTEFILVMENQLDKMKWLITNLLKISRLDAGVVELKCDTVSCKNIINRALEPFALSIELKEITINKNINDFQFDIDVEWTVEALQNIIKNCIEHMASNGDLQIDTISTNIYDCITIKDDGCGIAKEDLPHIFERFYHGKNSSSESVGIGLALAKTILEKENANISVSSTEGVGTEFTIKFYKTII